MAIVFPRRGEDGKPRYSVFARCHLNESAVMAARNPSYPGWANSGALVVTPGDETDFGRIEGDLRELCGRFRVGHRSLIVGWAVKSSVQRLSGDARAVMGVPVGSWFSPRSA